ncbi:YdaS family helix-turn-helix protein [Marinomonas arenicola]|uniref:YdaS family helix-turn-helix protein n=1 Tax=Marinomonas arenicola TaxID=569601 RepID=UPI00311F024F
MTAIEKAVDLIGSQTALAKTLDVTQAHVWNWLRIHKRAPAKYIRKIAEATNGEISVNDLLKDHEDL